MSGRVAVVVGAGGELGRATAEKLAAAGFTVAGIRVNAVAPQLLDTAKTVRTSRWGPAAALSHLTD
jgi:NAD(P)-dependent dehydrogenase (short-subunit alcohol dehydrogenase family)